jgi:anti-anti-sigma factor
MTRVWFIDATGLRRLMRARDHVHARGGRLALTRGPEAVMRIIELTGLSDDLLILETPDAPFDEPLPAV